MKKLALYLFCVLPIAKAENITNILVPEFFPDDNFRNELILIYGTLSLDEVGSVTNILMDSKGIHSLQGLHFFYNLQTLSVSNNSLTELPDLPLFEVLISLNAENNQLQTLPDMSIAPRLFDLKLSHNQLNTQALIDANLSSLTSLAILKLDHNQLTTLPDISTLNQLGLLNVDHNQLTHVPNLSSLDQLGELTLDHNQLSSLPELNKLTQLQHLDVSHNLLSTLPDLSSLTELRFVAANNNQLTDVSGLAANPTILHFQGDYVDISRNQLSAASCSQIAPLTERAFNHVEGDAPIDCPTFKYFFQNDGIVLGCRTPGAIADDALLLSLTQYFDSNQDFFLCRDEIELVTWIVLPAGSGVQDLWGVQNMTHLQDVSLPDQNITTLAPLVENQNFMDTAGALIVPQNYLGEDYPARCVIESRRWDALDLSSQKNEVDYFQDPCGP